VNAPRPQTELVSRSAVPRIAGEDRDYVEDGR